MVDGPLSPREKQQSASVPAHSRPLMSATAAAGRSAVCEKDNCTDSSLYSFTTAVGEPPEFLSAVSTTMPVPQGIIAIIGAASNTLKRSWFWYSHNHAVRLCIWISAGWAGDVGRAEASAEEKSAR